MNVYEEIPLKFNLGNKAYSYTFIVADLHNMCGLLGIDFF